MQVRTKVEATYAKWLAEVHTKYELPGYPVLTSGVPSVGDDVDITANPSAHVSDVDVNVLLRNNTDLENTHQLFQDGLESVSINDHITEGWFTVTFIINSREVNVRYTINVLQLRRTLAHRNNEIALATQFPELSRKVAALKVHPDGTKFMSTEPAWAKVLGFTGTKDEAYDYLASDLNILIDAAKKVSE